MSESKHTLGPWTLRSNSIDQEHVINAPSWDGLAIVYGNEDDELDAQGFANARLIAAAPDLLHALESRLDFEVCECNLVAVGPEYANPCPKCRASAIIARARGES